ncbi:MAG: response regulator [Nitrospirae bacterium]|nr:response regulator [Nitrospirota bacterium]
MSAKAWVLIVDDQRELREFLRYTLKDKYAVAVAGEAEEAIKYMTDYQVDLVLLDFNMPKMDGLTALKEIKKIRPDTEVIMMTGYAPPDTRKEALESGAFAFFMKPFDIDELLKTINEALKKCNLRTMSETTIDKK